MKKNDWLIVGGLLAGYLLLKSKSADAREDINNGIFGPGIESGTYTLPPPNSDMQSNQTAAMKRYADTVDAFNKSQNIQSGLDVANAGYPNGYLPRLSQTISKGNNSNVARLADGSTARVTVVQPARDSKGQTNFDRIIAKNKAARGY